MIRLKKDKNNRNT